MAKKKQKQARRLATAEALLQINAAVLTALMAHLSVTPLQGVAAILRRHSQVTPFPNPVIESMSLSQDFRLSPIGRENMAPDLSALRGSLGKKGRVSRDAARRAGTVGDLVKLVTK